MKQDHAFAWKGEETQECQLEMEGFQVSSSTRYRLRDGLILRDCSANVERVEVVGVCGGG